MSNAIKFTEKGEIVVSIRMDKKQDHAVALHFSVKDDISGVASYEAYVDGEWVLVEYMRNKKSAFLELDRVEPKNSKRNLELTFKDFVGNQTTMNYNFYY